MAADADLEVGLAWDRKHSHFDVSLRFDVPGTDTDKWERSQDPLRLDLSTLENLKENPTAYAAALSEMVMGREDIRTFYERARQWIEGKGSALHLRLHIDAPPALHALRWELLTDPATDLPIATQDRVLLSRYLSSANWRPVASRPYRTMRAVVAVAAPTDVGKYRNADAPLAAVDAGAELTRARASLQGYDIIRELGAEHPATLANLLSSLEMDVDVLYLVCHGLLTTDVPRLLLVGEDGRADQVDGRLLVERLSELDKCPVIVVLNSCQSAGTDDPDAGDGTSADGGVLSALGPRLAGVGVAAVVAMQGNVTMRSAATFASTFFSAFERDAVVDRAMAAARRALVDERRPDWWVPVLFSRLRSGRTQYRPAFADREDKSWNNLAKMIQRQGLTPVLGPGLADDLVGSRQDIARLWVRRWQMPLAVHNQTDLAQVAQFLRVSQSPAMVRSELIEYFRVEATNRSRQTDSDVADAAPAILDELDAAAAMREMARRQRAADPGEPYRVMAALPLPVYITTGWADLLEDALRERDREPITLAFPWNATHGRRRELRDKPTVDHPLVYHMFGRFDDPRSLVVTEDDYFDWLKAWIFRRLDIPAVVREALTSKSLLFLGYRLDDWDFRVIFQSIKSFEGGQLLKENLHSGVQLSPENQSVEPEAAQEYLESYFGSEFSIYWGNTRRFLDELRAKIGLQP